MNPMDFLVGVALFAIVVVIHSYYKKRNP